MSWYENRGGKLILNLHIQPRAKLNEIAGVHNGRLKVRLKAPPVDGKANACLLAFLAEQFQVKRNEVVLESGVHGRDKRVSVEGPYLLPAWFETLDKGSGDA